MFEIDISLSKQQLDVYRDAELVGSYSISSGVAGVGCEKGSGKTPIGKHIIRAKIGYDQPVNSVFIGRRPTGEIYSSELAKDQPNRDWILCNAISIFTAHRIASQWGLLPLTVVLECAIKI